MNGTRVRIVGTCSKGHVVHVGDSTECDIANLPEGELKRLRGRNKRALECQHKNDHQCHEALEISVRLC